jgi:hypothetical protein
MLFGDAKSFVGGIVRHGLSFTPPKRRRPLAWRCRVHSWFSRIRSPDTSLQGCT